MSRRKTKDTTKPTDETMTDTPAEDTEGHSIGLVLGMLAIEEADRATQKERAARRPTEELPPLTKAWPNMRQAAVAVPETKAEAEPSSVPLVPQPALKAQGHS